MVEKVVKNNFFHDSSRFGRPNRGVVFDNFFHFFHEFLRKSLESYKWWKKLSKTTFSTIFVKKKTSSQIRGKSGKSCQNQFFPRLTVLEAEIVEKVGFDNFFHQ